MEILTTQPSEKTSTLKHCYFCGTHPASYTCPRCEAPYCTLKCYKSEQHVDCSETFYKESFMRDLKEKEEVSSEEKARILEMIERTYEENPLYNAGVCDDEDGEEDEEDLETRMGDLDISKLNDNNIEEVLARLTKRELDNFHAMIDSGRIFDIYEKETGVEQQWKPYWHKHDNGLVEELLDDVKEKAAVIPPTLVASVSKSSPSVAFNLLNALYPYCVFQSIYNGVGHKDFPLDFIECLLGCSTFLATNAVMTTADDALVSALIKCRECCAAKKMPITEGYLVESLRSTSHLLMGPSPDDSTAYVKRALRHVQKASEKARRALKKADNVEGGEDEKKQRSKHLYALGKKLNFLMSWCEQNKNKLGLMSIEVIEIFKSRVSELKTTTSQQQIRQKSMVKLDETSAAGKTEDKPKIVEMD